MKNPYVKKLLSMKAMAISMLIFALSVAVATFIENDFDTNTAKAVVYNATWFELLQLYVVTILIYNIITYKMYKDIFSMKFIFHAAFIIIFLGAIVTRYAGYEGTLHIREGETENRLVSMISYIQMRVMEAGKVSAYENEILFSKLSSNHFDEEYSNGSHHVRVELLEYIPSATYELHSDANGKPIFEMMVVGGGGPETITLSEGEYYENDSHVISFNAQQKFDKPTIHVFMKEGQLYLDHTEAITTLSMATREEKTYKASAATPFNMKYLHSAGQTRFVLKSFFEKGNKTLVSKENEVRKGMNASYQDALKFRISSGEESKELIVFGQAQAVGAGSSVRINDLNIMISYGAKIIPLPFAIHLKDFELERYPGSMAPSSYASEVILIDKEQNLEQPYRIYMNHVLDHRGFRLFQSSYDKDELGTVLSVNFDFWGTWITYTGYILLAFGLFGSFFTKKGRFQTLRKQLGKLKEARSHIAALLVAVGLAWSPALHAEDHSGHDHAQEEQVPFDANMSAPDLAKKMQIDRKHANAFGRLLVQTSGGRLMPVDTLGRDILLKVAKKTSLLGLNSNQVIVGMMTQPQIWSNVPMIKLHNSEIAKLLHLDPKQKYASFSHFYPLGMGDTYILEHYVNDARRKPAKTRNKLDKALLKVDEAVHISQMVYMGVIFEIFPKPNDKTQKWYHLLDVFKNFDQQAAMTVRGLFLNYFLSLDEALKQNNWDKPNEMLGYIKKYQEFNGAAIYPSNFAISLEILYNKINIFQWLMAGFLILGLILLIMAFINIIKPKVNLQGLTKGGFYILVGFFSLYTLGLIARWIIAGHAPWSNGYEALVYIGWSTLVAGFLVSRNSPLTLAATALLSGVILLVAMMSSFDPQITNLVPVLKSYWLTIHVSMITASYGFLALAALLGFIGLILFVMLKEVNAARISASIKEINLVSEMSILMGLALLTVGNFLGGVWANESWGRYWGWDAKETWALVSILVYAVVAHLRYIPKFYTDFRYSVITVLSFSTILMTFFGVNYYLSGLHSYAKGDPVPVPSWVYVALLLVALLIAAAFSKRKRFIK